MVLRVAYLAFVVLPAAFCWGGKVSLLPGLAYSDGKEKLEGRLLFLASAEAGPTTNGVRPCFLYELDLSDGRLRRVAQAPACRYFEDVIVCADGKACAATFPERVEVGVGYQKSRPQLVWMYCETPPLNQVLSLDDAPLRRVALGHHVFFQLAGRIADCDLERGTSRLLQLPGVSKWDRQGYELYAQQRKTNEFCFEYHHGGARTAEGTDYDSGTYVYELQTGRYRSTARPEPSPTEGSRACDGSLVSLTGIDHPYSGHELMRYPLPGGERPAGKGTTGKAAIMLKRFRSSASNDIKSIKMSPCRRYVLICEEAQLHPWVPGGYDTLRTYHAVNVLTGHAWVLLKDDVERKTGGFMSEMNWLASETPEL